MKTFLKALLYSAFAFGYTFPCHSANVSPEVKFSEVSDFSGGMNTSVPPHKLDTKFSPNMRNVFIHRKPGAIIKANGYTLAGSTNTLSDGRFMFTFNKEDGSKYFIVSDGSRVLSTADFTTYVLVSSGLNNSVNLDMAQVRNKVWITNGSDPIVVWDGTNRQILSHVPKGRYIEFFQERVFLLNTAGEGSSLDFSELTSTDGIALDPADTRAWPATNRLYVGRGDGQTGTALWPYKSQLQIGKENSIYTLYGTGVTSYYVRKSESDIGVQSNDSVVVQDGVSYFKSKNGIYAWDGGLPVRISDAIEPDVQNMLSFDTRIIQNLWETQDQFSKGSLSGSTVSPNGFVAVSDYDLYLNSIYGDVNFNTTSNLAFSQCSSTRPGTGYIVFQPTITVPQNALVYFEYINLKLRGNAIVDLRVNVKNLRTGQVATFARGIQSPNASSWNDVTFRMNIDNDVQQTQVLFSSSDIGNGFCGIEVTTKTIFSMGPTDVFDVLSPTVPGQAFFHLLPGTTGQFTSDVATITTLTAWSGLDSIRGTLGGSIDYFYRTSTSSVNIATQPWVSITPGSQINAPIINNYIQWASTINSVSSGTANSSYIDNVTIQHVEGGGDKYRPTAVNWNNEYWLTVTTQTRVPTSLTYVKSWITNPNPNAWQPMDGLNIGSFCKNGNSALYGGSLSTGSFYRLDYGTNYNGLPIEAYYDTPDMDFGDTFKEKSIQVLNVNSEKEENSILTISVSTNSAQTFANVSTFSITGVGEFIKPMYGISALRGYQYRIRIGNNQLDKGLTYNNLGIWYLPKDIWANTQE